MMRTCLALAATITLVSSSRADLIPWQYSWTPSPTNVSSDTGNSLVHFKGEGWTSIVGDSRIPAATLTTKSNVTSFVSDTFTNREYSVTLRLRDGFTGKEGAISFTGVINGTLSSSNSLLENSFTGETSKELVVGGTRFKVTVDQFTSPGRPDIGSHGSIGAKATVTVEAIIQELPEPGTLALGGIGAGAIVLMRRRKRTPKV